MQAILLVSLLALGLIPLGGIGIWIALAVLVFGGIASATQDTATDGMVAQSLRARGLAHANALQIGGMMAGFGMRMPGGRIGGADVARIGKQGLCDLVTVVFQDVVLFSGTIRDNIALAKQQASQAEIESAARAAQAHEFVMALPQGYDSPARSARAARRFTAESASGSRSRAPF